MSDSKINIPRHWLSHSKESLALVEFDTGRIDALVTLRGEYCDPVVFVSEQTANALEASGDGFITGKAADGRFEVGLTPTRMIDAAVCAANDALDRE